MTKPTSSTNGSSQVTRSISFTPEVFKLLEEKRKAEGRDRSNFVSQRLKEYFVSIGWVTPDGKIVPRGDRKAA